MRVVLIALALATGGCSDARKAAGAGDSTRLARAARDSSGAAVPVSAPVTRDDLAMYRRGIAAEIDTMRAIVAAPGFTRAAGSGPGSGQAALTARVRAMVESPAWQETLQRTGWTDLYADGAAFRQFLLAEQARIMGVTERLQAGRAATRGGLTPSPRTAPAAAVVLALSLGALLVWQRRGSGTGVAPSRGGHRRVAAVTAACLAQSLLMPVIGFIPTAAAVFATGAYALGSTRVLYNVAVGLAVASVLAALFGAGLDVPLPMGAWTR